VDVAAFEEAPQTCLCFKGFAALFFRSPGTLASLFKIATDVLRPSSRAINYQKSENNVIKRVYN